MTTTSTFQGMNTDSKPSSRVLNPPGGASSNIFGYDDNTAPQRTPIKNNPDNVNRGNNDIFHQGNPPTESTSHVRSSNRNASDIFNQGTESSAHPSKGRAPRSGELYEQTNPKQEQASHLGSQVKCDDVSGDVASGEVKSESIADVKIPEAEDKNDTKSNKASDQSVSGIFGSGPAGAQEHRSTRLLLAHLFCIKCIIHFRSINIMVCIRIFSERNILFI
ncbi:hypothetical protein Btru_053106 [Bulinus truncatus]|nr:hypothetical protein Btru_053106 [Bulinus truncatus]